MNAPFTPPPSSAVEPPIDHRALDAAVRARMAADSRIVSAKAMAWRLGGIGLLGFLLLTGGALLMLAYARYTDVSASAEKIADAFTEALSRSTLKAEGVVKIADGQKVAMEDGVVRLKDGGVVGLRDATVRLADGATVGVRGSVGVSGDVGVRGDVGGRDTGAGGQGARNVTTEDHDAAIERRLDEIAKASKGGKVASNYVKFFDAPFGSMTVSTGWKFDSSNDARPSDQFCYVYIKGNNNEGTKVDIGSNGHKLPMVYSTKVDVDAAVDRCIWFDGQRTVH
jgi:hypothetical protein